MGLVEICNRLGIAKSTACLVLSELCASGYLIQEHRTLLYGLGMKVGLQTTTYNDPEVLPADFSIYLDSLHEKLALPMSVVSQSRRSSIVTHTIQACSIFARLGFRRPFVAPFGGCFLVNASKNERDQWINLALQMEERNLEQLSLSINERLNRILCAGYEVVHQWEQEILDSWELKFPAWMGDLFEVDARTNAYRRDVLRAGTEWFKEDAMEQRARGVSRIIIPLSKGVSTSLSCIEFWLDGKQMTASDIEGFVETVKNLINKRYFD